MKDSDQSKVEQPDSESEVEGEDNSDRNEFKIVLSLKNGRGFIGIQAPECDPILTMFEGDLGAALEQVPALLQQAQDKWAENAKYPKANVPAPPAPPPRQTTPSRQPVKAKTAQPSMF